MTGHKLQMIAVAIAGLAAQAALLLWWRGGMWDHGEMPTKGLALALSGAGAAIAFALARRFLQKTKDG